MQRKARKSQSAMEYLMTYGWAILIIAVVLGALFQLGVFNAGAFSPRAPPGACQVFRPNGPGSTTNINLEGVCNGELPQYAGTFSGVVTSNVVLSSDTNFPTGTQQISIFAWIKSSQSTTYPFIFNYGKYGTNQQNWMLAFYDGQACVDVWGSGPCAGPYINNNAWHFVGFTYPGSYPAILYVDGSSYSLTPGLAPNAITGAGTVADIGYGYGSYFTGSIADVQIYNTSLSGPEANALYDEGIGGAPIKLQNLVGWWPLNGNANDYSGNNDNGVPNSVTYTNQWTSGYTPP